MREEFEKALWDVISFLIGSCPQKGYIPFEEYAFQEDVKTYLHDLLSLQPEDMEVFLGRMSFLEMLKRLLGEHLLHFSRDTLLWVAEIEKGLGMLREMSKRNRYALFAALQE